jgi:hypothetical protein
MKVRKENKFLLDGVVKLRSKMNVMKNEIVSSASGNELTARTQSREQSFVFL